MKIRLFSLLIAFALLLTLMPGAYADEADHRPIVGLAWRRDRESETFVATCKAIEAAGGRPVSLEQVLSADFVYEDNMLVGDTDENGVLTAEAVKRIRCNTWQGSNVEDVMDGISAIVFPGGEDICPSLYYSPKPVEALEGFSAERDISDFLLMSWCLERDVPILAICRGMQMLSVVSGADMIQDLPVYMDALGKEYKYGHRNEPEIPGAYRDFAYHDVTVTDENSILYQLTGSTVVHNAPSWHHQAVKSVEGTRLKVTGITETDGIDIIEAVERVDKTFVLGLQYHPEIAVVREMDENALVYFQAIVDRAKGM